LEMRASADRSARVNLSLNMFTFKYKTIAFENT
jgi:hypothetical protein